MILKVPFTRQVNLARHQRDRNQQTPTPFDRHARWEKKIDYSDIPPLPTAGWVKTHIPYAKKQVTLRLDGDVLDFFRETGRFYQSRINDALRAHMEAHRSKPPLLPTPSSDALLRRLPRRSAAQPTLASLAAATSAIRARRRQKRLAIIHKLIQQREQLRRSAELKARFSPDHSSTHTRPSA